MSNVSLRKRAYYTIAIAAINFLGFLMLTVTISQIFIWPTILVPFGAGLYLLSLRCPKCGNRIYKRKVRIFGEEFIYWGGIFVPKRCSHCNTEFIHSITIKGSE